MEIPFIKYIEAMLVIHRDVNKVYDEIKQLNIPMADAITKDVLNTIFSEFFKTNPEYFSSINQTIPNLDWLREHNIHKMVAYHMKLELGEGPIGIIGAYELLKDRSMYQLITALGLANVTEDDIDLLVNSRFNIHFEAHDIKEFLHYFFKVDKWPLSLKKDYLQFVNDTELIRAYRLALQGDKDYLLWKLGIAPDQTFEEMLHSMMADSFFNFKEKMTQDPESARKWGDLAMKITDRMDRLDKEKRDKKSLFESIVFAINSQPIANIMTSNQAPNIGDIGLQHINNIQNEDNGVDTPQNLLANIQSEEPQFSIYVSKQVLQNINSLKNTTTEDNSNIPDIKRDNE